SSGTTTGGTTGPGPSCGWGLVWYGDVCAASSCFYAPQGAGCVLPDGGFATCVGQSCGGVDLTGDSKNFGARGLQCPPGFYCENSQCEKFTMGGTQFVECAAQHCGVNLTCVDFLGCVPTSCSGNNACILDAGPPLSALGECCTGGACVD